jgi:hypothetical protein
MDCDGRPRRIFRNLHEVCQIFFFDAAGFPTANPAAVDLDSLAADLGAVNDAIGGNSLDNVYELLQRISSHFCRAIETTVGALARLTSSIVLDESIHIGSSIPIRHSRWQSSSL